MADTVSFKLSEGLNVVEFNSRKYYLTDAQLLLATKINNIKQNMAMFCKVVDEMKLGEQKYGYSGRARIGGVKELMTMFIATPEKEGLFNQLVYSDTWASDGGALEEEVVADGTSELVDNETNDGANVKPLTSPKKKKKKKKSA
jgi:hypothetical protein